MDNIQCILPEIIILVGALAALLLTVFSPREQNLSYYTVQGSLLIAAICWIYHGLPINPQYALQNDFVLDKLAVILKIFVAFMTFFIFWYSKQYLTDRHIQQGEYYVLGLLSTFGMFVLISGHHLLVLFLGLELMSLPIYAMVALQHSNGRSIEAAAKYFVVGALASGLLLYGVSLLFGATQALDLAQVAIAVTHLPQQQVVLVMLGFVFILSGLAFKLGAAPFHMWVPDVYEGAPTSVTLLLATVPKLAGFSFLIRILSEALPALALPAHEFLVFIAILSMALGNFVAIMQTNLKRMFAYSSIAHMGYTLLGLLCNTPKGDSAALFYILTYTLMTMAAFAILMILSKSGFEADQMEDLAGLNSRNPWLAFLMLLVLFSMAGIPPVVGFMAKVGVLEALIQVHQVWLVVVALLFAIIGAYYYIRVVKVMYFEAPRNTHPSTHSRSLGVILGANAMAVLLLGLFPGILFTLCHGVF